MKPLLHVLFDALKERGWTMRDDGAFIDPEGNRHSLYEAIAAQTFREIAQGEGPTGEQE